MPIIIILMVVVAMISVYMIMPEENKILVPLGLFSFITGIILFQDKSPLLILLLGTIYWFLYDLFERVSILDNPMVAWIYSPIVMTLVVGFLIGKFLGKYLLSFLGIGG